MLGEGENAAKNPLAMLASAVCTLWRGQSAVECSDAYSPSHGPQVNASLQACAKKLNENLLPVGTGLQFASQSATASGHFLMPTNNQPGWCSLSAEAPLEAQLEAINAANLCYRGVASRYFLGGCHAQTLQEGSMRPALAAYLEEHHIEFEEIPPSVLTVKNDEHVTGGVDGAGGQPWSTSTSLTLAAPVNFACIDLARVSCDHDAVDYETAGVVQLLDTRASSTSKVNYAAHSMMGGYRDDGDVHPFIAQAEVICHGWHRDQVMGAMVLTLDDSGRVPYKQMKSLLSGAYVPMSLAWQTDEGQHLYAIYQARQSKLDLLLVRLGQDFYQARRSGDGKLAMDLWRQVSDCLLAMEENRRMLIKAVNLTLEASDGQEHLINADLLSAAARDFWARIRMASQPYLLVTNGEKGEGPSLLIDDNTKAGCVVIPNGGEFIEMPFDQVEATYALQTYLSYGNSVKECDLSFILESKADEHVAAKEHLVLHMLRKARRRYPDAIAWRELGRRPKCVPDEEEAEAVAETRVANQRGV